MNFWMIYTSSAISKDSRKLKIWVEGECTLHHWPGSSETYECSGPFQKVYLVDDKPTAYGSLYGKWGNTYH